MAGGARRDKPPGEFLTLCRAAPDWFVARWGSVAPFPADESVRPPVVDPSFAAYAVVGEFPFEWSPSVYNPCGVCATFRLGDLTPRCALCFGGYGYDGRKEVARLYPEGLPERCYRPMEGKEWYAFFSDETIRADNVHEHVGAPHGAHNTGAPVSNRFGREAFAVTFAPAKDA